MSKILLLIILAKFFSKLMIKISVPRQALPYQKTISFYKQKLSYQILGKGKPVILLHGSITSEPWGNFASKLAKDYKVYLLDLPGFGASDAIPNRIHNTNLFAKALTVFIKKNKLQKAPIVALSLGTVVAAKTAAQNHTQGKLILVGMPTQTFGLKFKMLNLLPLAIKRLVAATEFGRRKLIIPVLMENISTQKNRRAAENKLLSAMHTTDTKALIDPDYQKDIVQDLPKLLKKVKNRREFVYGEIDPQRQKTDVLLKKYLIIPKLGHNIFAENPKEALKIIKPLLK